MKITVAVIALLLAQTAQSAASNACTTPNYEDHNQIDYGPLRLSKVAGLAIDSFGAAVPQTCVYLFTEKTHRLVAGAEVDSNGKLRFRASRQALTDWSPSHTVSAHQMSR